MCESKLVEKKLNYMYPEAYHGGVGGAGVDLGPVETSLVLVFELTKNDDGLQTLGNMHEAWSVATRLIACDLHLSYSLSVCTVPTQAALSHTKSKCALTGKSAGGVAFD